MNLSGPLIHCPCYRSPSDQDALQGTRDGAVDSNEDDIKLSLIDPRTISSLFPLEELYFCDDCHVHRCPRCVTEEIVSIFCPNCLFEIPSKTGSSESHCPRNCFACPRCQATMQTIGKETESYNLVCTYCHWSSSDVGLIFQKASGLAGQIGAQRPNAQLSAYENAKSIFLSDQSVQESQQESESAKILRQYRTAMGKTPVSDVFETLKPPQLDDQQDIDISALLAETKLTTLTTLKQRLLQSSSSPQLRTDLLPLNVRLRTKRTKRCRQCRYLLVKPDPKPLSVNFRSRRYASRVLPTMSFQPMNASSLVPRYTSQWKLKLTNPLPEPCTFSLATASKTEEGDHIVMLCSELTIGPTSELWEDSDAVMMTSSPRGELYEIGRNFASVILEITAGPRKVMQDASGAATSSVGENSVAVRFPVFVQMCYHVDPELNNTAEGGSQQDKGNKIRKEIGFWTLLDTGQKNRV